jgi:type IX secretion system PorP/SprF family membrane protein
MKKIILLTLVVVTAKLYAQQDPIYSQYMLNPLLINPAYTGINNNLNVMMGYRTQWTGYEGQPQTISANAHSSFLDNKVGAGIQLMRDQIGNINTTETNLSFAYKLQFKETVLSFGMQGGVQNFKTDYSKLTIYDPTDNAFIGGDRGTRVNLGAGVILKSEKYFIGFSVPRLLPTKFSNSGGQQFELYNQHYYLNAAYVFYINERIRLKPYALLRGVKGAPASVDLAFNVNFNAVHTAGIFTRNFNTYGVILQTMLKEKYRFGYVFEMPTNKSVGTAYTTHEITLGLRLSAFRFQNSSVSNF